MSRNKLNAAVHECIERCYSSRQWLPCIAEFAERLKKDGWPKVEIEKVELAVHHILTAVIKGNCTTA
jgi:hypothetical protein